MAGGGEAVELDVAGGEAGGDDGGGGVDGLREEVGGEREGADGVEHLGRAGVCRAFLHTVGGGFGEHGAKGWDVLKCCGGELCEKQSTRYSVRGYYYYYCYQCFLLITCYDCCNLKEFSLFFSWRDLTPHHSTSIRDQQWA